MNASALHCRPLRLRAALAVGVSLVLALGAAASSLPGAVAATHAATRARAATSGGVWGKAEEVPGLAALNRRGFAEVTSVSCAQAGNCSAGGTYTDGSGRQQGFIAGETGGVWGKAEEVPGLAALNRRGFAEVTSVSCARAGNCSAGGGFRDRARSLQGFVVGEAGGVWGQAEEVPGLAALNTGGFAEVTSVWCARAGNCSAGGFYSGHGGRIGPRQGFVVGETGGVWGQAEEVPGLAALNTGELAEVTSVSCARAGNCSAGGLYTGRSGTQAFVVGETGGVWGQAEEVPGLAALNTGGFAEVTSMSCARAGNCSAGGTYTDGSGRQQGFVAGETGGVWGKVKEVPGLAALNTGGFVQISSMSCARAGTCSAGGLYTGRSGRRQGFVVGETGGVWGQAKQVPGLAALNTGGFAKVFTVSCARAGNCSAGGLYTGRSGTQAFVVGETGGVWGRAEEVPGLAALNTGGFAAVTSVSCPRAGNCSAGGIYTDRSGGQGFVVNEKGAHPSLSNA